MLLGLGIIVGLPLLVIAVGLLLPETIHRIGTAKVPVEPEVLWTRLMDGEHFPVSSAMARSVTALPDEDGRPAWTEHIGHSKVTVRTVEADAPRKLVRELSDSVVPMTARWTFSILPDGEGSIVSIENHTVVAHGTWHVPFFRVMTRVFGAVRKGMEQYVRSLAGGGDVHFEWS